MDALQFVPVLGQRIEEHPLLKAGGKTQVLLSSGRGVEVAKRFLHAAELRLENALSMLVADALEIVPYPGCHLLCHIERLLVAAVQISIKKARHDLVIGVKGRPDSAAFAQAVKQL